MFHLTFNFQPTQTNVVSFTTMSVVNTRPTGWELAVRHTRQPLRTLIDLLFMGFILYYADFVLDIVYSSFYIIAF